MATTGETTTAAVLLKSPKDWTRWLALIKNKAVTNSLWENIDPTVASPPALQPPVKPQPADVVSTGNASTATIATLTTAEFQRYNAELIIWQEELKDYRNKVKTITEIEDHIIKTAGTYWSTIEKVTGVHAQLVKLKQRVAPTDYAREQEVIRQYNLIRTQAKSTRTEEWITSWETALRDAIELKIPDVQDIRPTRHFLQAVEKIDPLFAQTWSNTIEMSAIMTPEQLMTVIPDGYQIAQIFRNQLLLKATITKGAFAGSTLQGQEAPATPTIPEQDRCPLHHQHKECDCYTLNKAKRPAKWRWYRQTAKAAIKLISNDAYKAKYHDILVEAKEFLDTAPATTTGSTNQKPATTPKLTGSAAVQRASQIASFASSPYALSNSFIMDSGSATHICNSRDRFQAFKALDIPEPVLTGDNSCYITGYGDVLLQVQTPTGQGLFLLKEVAYIPGFHTNVVAHKRLRKAGYSWDDVNNQVVKDSQAIFYLREQADQYVIEYNEPTAQSAFPASSRAPRQPREADAYLWHLRSGHPSQEALEKLLTESYGVKIKGQLRNACESCALATANRQISRRAANRTAPRPLWRIHLDLFQLTPSSVGYERALVIQDEHSGLIWVYPLPNKTQEEVTTAVENFANMAKRQWGLDIAVIRRDNEKALGKRYNAWIQQQGIQEEPSPVYTPEPNGRAERSGGVIRAKALAMQLSANLPTELWPETWQAAAYLYNRSPREANQWKSPIEKLNRWLRDNDRDIPDIYDKPDLSNLYAYGCRAYPLKETIQKDVDKVSRRTSPRAYIGYLVGYEGSNIYRIWVPTKATVIRTRDVQFNEDEFFNPNVEQPADEPLASYQIDAVQLDPIEHTDSDIEANIDQPATLQPSTQQPNHQDNRLESSESSKEDSPTAYPTPDQSREATPTEQSTRSRDSTSTGQPTRLRPLTSTGQPTASRGTTSTEQRTGSLLEQQQQLELPPDNSQREQFSRPRRNRQLTSRAQQNLEQSGDPYRGAFTTTTTQSSFHIGTQHRLHRRNLPLEPRTWKELQQHQYRADFIEATKKEWDNINAMRTLQVIRRNDAKTKPLPLTWVFKYKYDKHGFITKFKARICVRGDLQPPTEKDTYAATLAAKSFRILMALAARWDLELQQLDAVNAFPNSPLDEEVYVELPDGFKQPGMVGRLLRALYGLRRSPLLWQRLLSTTLVDLGLKCANEEPCLFVNDWLIVFFFVDDIVYMYRTVDNDKAADFSRQLTGRFKMRDLGNLRWFLGIRVTRDRPNRLIWLCQDSYIENIAARFNLDQLNGHPTTPISPESLIPNEEIADQASTHLYQRKVGSIIYAAVITRPDIAKAATTLSTYLTNPSAAHMAAANRCIQYLYGTRQLGIQFNNRQLNSQLDNDSSELAVYTDASFADNKDRKSSQGYLITLFGGPIAWKSGKQDTITTSSTEAELLALTAVAKEAIATLRLFAGMRFQLTDRLNIWCDNKQTIRLVNSELPRLRTALRHVDIHNNWARQEVQNNTFSVNYLPTDLMPADGLTKALPREKFKIFVKLLGLIEAPQLIEDNDDNNDVIPLE